MRAVPLFCADLLNVMTISFPVFKSFSLTTLLGFLDFQDLRGQQSEFFLIAIGSRYAVHRNLELRCCHCG